MKSTYEARWGHKRGAPNKANPQGNAHNHGKRIRRERLRAEAQERDWKRSRRSPHDQLALLDSRPGASARERARLIDQISRAH